MHEPSDQVVEAQADIVTRRKLQLEVRKDGNAVLYGPSRAVVLRRIGDGTVQVDELRFPTPEAAINAALDLFAPWPETAAV